MQLEFRKGASWQLCVLRQGQRSRTRSRPTLNDDAMDAQNMDLTFHPRAQSAPQAQNVYKGFVWFVLHGSTFAREFLNVWWAVKSFLGL